MGGGGARGMEWAPLSHSCSRLPIPGQPATQHCLLPCPPLRRSRAVAAAADCFAAAFSTARGGFVRDTLAGAYPRLAVLLEGVLARVLRDSAARDVAPAVDDAQVAGAGVARVAGREERCGLTAVTLSGDPHAPVCKDVLPHTPHPVPPPGRGAARSSCGLPKRLPGGCAGAPDRGRDHCLPGHLPRAAHSSRPAKVHCAGARGAQGCGR